MLTKTFNRPFIFVVSKLYKKRRRTLMMEVTLALYFPRLTILYPTITLSVLNLLHNFTLLGTNHLSCLRKGLCFCSADVLATPKLNYV